MSSNSIVTRIRRMPTPSMRRGKKSVRNSSPGNALRYRVAAKRPIYVAALIHNFSMSKRQPKSRQRRLHFETLEARQVLSSISLLPVADTYTRAGVNAGTADDARNPRPQRRRRRLHGVPAVRSDERRSHRAHQRLLHAAEDRRSRSSSRVASMSSASPTWPATRRRTGARRRSPTRVSAQSTRPPPATMLISRAW